ncbi:MAG: multi-sensor signal transduction histidine kinase, partial [Caulobacteraceae bacterium]|nr:multi-sensor signal transduction histidine kinase [Caulobacteraceae bacterium]
MANVAVQLEGARGPLRKPVRYLFGVAFAIAACLTAVAVWYVSSAPGATSSTIAAPSSAMLAVLWANLGLILLLAGVVAWRLFSLVASRDRAGARLHLRFVMMFAGAAVIPAIVVALFFGLLVTRGVDSWFSARIRTLVDSSTMVSRAYMQDHRAAIYSNTRDVAAALEPFQPMLASDPDGYRLRLEAIVSQGYFDAIYVLNGGSQVLAKAEGTSPRSYPLPSAAKLREAQRDFLISDVDVHDSLTSLYRLRGYEDAYLYGIRHVDPAIFSLVKDTSDASAFYAEVDKNRARIQSVFQLSYAETA